MFLSIIVVGCGNEYDVNRQRAEEIALDRVQGRTFQRHTIERTLYDEKTGEFIVYVSPREEGEEEIIVVIRFLENGSHWIDFDRLEESLR